MSRVPSTSRRPVARLRRRLAPYATHVLAASAGILVFLVASQLFPYHSANHDEAVYLQHAAMLLDGQLTITPPVADAFRPWFFVADGQTLYPKYSPVTAAIIAIPLALGVPRLALAVVAASIVALTVAIGTDLFDRRTGLIAGALLLTSPLFVIDTATFLPYAPTTALNLAFAYAYLRAERENRNDHRTSLRWAALAGVAIGLAFFARPYTAVLFAAPFIAHAGWPLVSAIRRDRVIELDRIRHRFGIVAFGLLGVLLALTYNWLLTGNPLLFPYEAFAPLDGLGFGQRELVGHGTDYTPVVALRTTRQVVTRYLLVWGPLGALGSLMAVLGLATARRNWDWRHTTVAGIMVSVVVGNAYFWGSYNLLGDLAVTGDGFISLLGPYYHFDLLVPTALFAAVGLRTFLAWATRHSRARIHGPSTRPVTAVLAVLLLLLAGTAMVASFDDPIEQNATVTAEYDAAYEPFVGAERPAGPAVVFLPEPYGPWLAHPFQVLRNDPDFDGETVYALQENEFRVVDTFPERTYYRYGYRGTWNPSDGRAITPHVQRVRTVHGETVTATVDVELPAEATSTSIRLGTTAGHAYYAAPADGPSQRLTIHLNDSAAWVTGDGISTANSATASLATSDEVVTIVNVNTESGGFQYRVVLPVSTTEGERRALTPILEVCTIPQFCGGGATYVPGPAGSPYEMNVTLRGGPHAERSA